MPPERAVPICLEYRRKLYHCLTLAARSPVEWVISKPKGLGSQADAVSPSCLQFRSQHSDLGHPAGHFYTLPLFSNIRFELMSGSSPLQTSQPTSFRLIVAACMIALCMVTTGCVRRRLT